jgi:hypothetical protein
MKTILFETIDGNLLVKKFNFFTANTLCGTKEREKIKSALVWELNFILLVRI